MPVGDPVGMGVAVEMLHHSTNRTGRVNKEGFISYAAMRRLRPGAFIRPPTSHLMLEWQTTTRS